DGGSACGTRTPACRPRRFARACAASSGPVPSSCCMTATATIRRATGDAPRPLSRGSSRMRGPAAIPAARSASWTRDGARPALAGEAARVDLIVQRGGVPAGAAVSSVVWTRVAEGLALALFLVMAPSVLQLEPWLRAVQSGVGLALAVVLLLAWGRGWASLADRLPAALRSRLAVLRTMGTGGRLVWPTAFALYNWAAQWSTYHLVLRATHVPVSSAASFPDLIAGN